jgi:hypothetical protein
MDTVRRVIPLLAKPQVFLGWTKYLWLIRLGAGLIMLRHSDRLR